MEDIHMKDRVCGIENEYGAIMRTSTGIVFTLHDNRHRENLERLLCADDAFGKYFSSEAAGSGCDSGLWLFNGGRLYIDNGLHPELATPECRRVIDAVVFNKAGERVVSSVFARSEDPEILLYKNNVARAPARSELESFSTYGCHENYMVCNIRELKREHLFPLFPFLITRQIFDGAGRWIDPEADTFVLSQRAFFFSEELSQTTTGKRPIINTKDDPMVSAGYSGEPFKRLHLILGDANMLEYALFLKIGVTRIILAMLEDGRLPEYTVENPVDSLHRICSLGAREKGLVRLWNLKSGTSESLSALEVQMQYCKAAAAYLKHTTFDSEESESEALKVHTLWTEALTAIAENDKQWMIGRLDYATKQFLAERQVERQKKLKGGGVSPGSIRQTIDLAYHEVGPRSLYTSFTESKNETKRNLFQRLTTDERIIHAMFNPPEDTRAYARGLIVQKAARSRKNPLSRLGWHVSSWHEPAYFSEGYLIGRPAILRYCEDPLNPKPEWLDEALNEFSNERS